MSEHAHKLVHTGAHNPLYELIGKIAHATHKHDVWYVSANARVPGGLIHLDADAMTILREPGLRKVGVHLVLNTPELWTPAVDCFAAIAHQYCAPGALTADLEATGEEGTISIEIKPKHMFFGLGSHNPKIQATQISEWRSYTFGHYRNKATIDDVSEEFAVFAKEALAHANLSSDITKHFNRSRSDQKGHTGESVSISTPYLQPTCTGVNNVLEFYRWANQNHDSGNVHLSFMNGDRRRGTACLTFDRNTPSASLQFGLGHSGKGSSWDMSVPALTAEEIATLERVLNYLVPGNLKDLTWNINDSCAGRDRGEHLVHHKRPRHKSHMPRVLAD